MKNPEMIQKNVSKKNILEAVEPVIKEAAEDLGLIILETSFVKESGNHILRIFIYDKEKPISHEECALMTHNLSDKMEEIEELDISYSLEVSSPGINRKLKNPIEYEVFKDKEVRVIFGKKSNPSAQGNVLNGTLKGLTENQNRVIVNIKGENKIFNLEEIKTIQLEG